MSGDKSDPTQNVGTPSHASRYRERRSITAIPLNGQNYPLWAKAVEVYYLGESEFSYLTDDPPVETASTYITWRATDARIRSELWNSMEAKVAGTLMFLDTAKQVWIHAQELYSGLNNLRRTFDLHQSWCSISQGDLSLDDYYAQFSRLCHELDICEPLSTDLQVVRRQRNNRNVARFLSGISSFYAPASNQILGSSNIPSLGEVFSRLRQSSVSMPTPLDRSALVIDSSGSSTGRGRARGRGRTTTSSGRGYGRNSGYGGRDSARGGRHNRNSRFCTHCHGTNHTVDTCYQLIGYPQAHQVNHIKDTGQYIPPSANSVVTISTEEYQRLISFQTDGPSTATLAQTGSATACVASSSSPWIIDSGATDHMTGSHDWEEDWWRC